MNKQKKTCCCLWLFVFYKSSFSSSENKYSLLLSLDTATINLFTIFKKKAKIYTSLDNSAKLYNEILSLPFYTGIRQKEQDIVIESIKSLNS